VILLYYLIIIRVQIISFLEKWIEIFRESNYAINRFGVIYNAWDKEEITWQK